MSIKKEIRKEAAFLKAKLAEAVDSLCEAFIEGGPTAALDVAKRLESELTPEEMKKRAPLLFTVMDEPPDPKEAAERSAREAQIREGLEDQLREEQRRFDRLSELVQEVFEAKMRAERREASVRGAARTAIETLDKLVKEAQEKGQEWSMADEADLRATLNCLLRKGY